MMDLNKVELTGILACAPRYVCEKNGERMYVGNVMVERTSGTVDTLPINMGEYTLGRKLVDMQEGTQVHIFGEMRDYRYVDQGVQRKGTSVFVREVRIDGAETGVNRATVTGTVMRAPVHRMTPLGREMCDLAVRVEGRNRTATVYMLAWGRMAQWARELEVGERVEAEGRLQSRNYEKMLEDGRVSYRTAYELSLYRLKRCEGQPCPYQEAGRGVNAGISQKGAPEEIMK